MSYHEFGLLDNVDKQQKGDIRYAPEKMDYLPVHDDIMEVLAERLSSMKTFYHSFDRPELGLAYCGITIIPPESLSTFYMAVLTNEYFTESKELLELSTLIKQAMERRKHIVHFGI